MCGWYLSYRTKYDNEIFSKYPLNPRIYVDVATTGFVFRAVDISEMKYNTFN